MNPMRAWANSSYGDTKEVNNTFYSGEYENGKLQDFIILAETKELEKKLGIPKR